MLSEKSNQYYEQLFLRYPALETCREDILSSYQIIIKAYENDRKLLIAGNGGSAADASHITGELMKSFKLKRKIDQDIVNALVELNPMQGKEIADKLEKGLPTIDLNSQQALNSAYLNDVDGKLCFAQAVMGYGVKGDVFLGITTSGNSENVVYASYVAKAKGMKVISLTGRDGGKIKEVSDASIIVPIQETYQIQEYHLPIYHILCLMIEEYFFGKAQ